MLCHHKPPYIFPQNSHHTYLSRHFHSLSEIYCHATSTSSRLDLHVLHVPATLAEAYIAYIMIATSSLCFEYLVKCERSSIPSCKLGCCPYMRKRSQSGQNKRSQRGQMRVKSKEPLRPPKKYKI